ncbi:lysM motif protein [Staphylococcus phage Stau2]|uniref:LysM domain-containing protein n=7 Tax=Silviavirus TaxID=1857889 RepID=A0A0U1ZUK0_9CAUD|nr:lysM motif protein [Staphylococcus phage SA11]YP_007677642.1 LysM domain-containing protein [Staphylococcus phage vB_SauM_Romulus]YP_008431282.1 lysM motif protein [Staphylococcus phage vB_SauM_Remus]YP_009275920.1 lysM motif protein [Staphylococcus phage Stau2]APC42867.1 membrane-bound lytic murein transglycosylase D precursor [Staphylococcus phage StAP1]ARQ95796.1 LysM domain-containing protein [Staphylococcus phage qdsa001]QQO38182.1 membrane-bound lytic murein transglycosylase D precur
MKDLIQKGNKFYYKVRNGDTLWTISKKYDVSIKQLQELNDMTSVSLSDKDCILVYVD